MIFSAHSTYRHFGSVKRYDAENTEAHYKISELLNCRRQWTLGTTGNYQLRVLSVSFHDVTAYRAFHQVILTFVNEINTIFNWK